MARYNVQDPRDYMAVLDFINLAKDKCFEIEVGKFYPKRSNNQNRYLYFCLSYFAHCYGCTVFEAKEVFLKRIAAPHIFEVEFETNGEKISYYKSTADVNTADMASAIRNFVAYANGNGIPIPEPDDELGMRFCEQEMEKSNGYK